eukprot:529833_1
MNGAAYDTYINSRWFVIDDAYYSNGVNVEHTDYAQCRELISEYAMDNETYRYGAHPCYTLDTTNPAVATAHPSSYPSISPTKEPTMNPTKVPTTHPTKQPTMSLTKDMTRNPTKEPAKSYAPTDVPVSAFETSPFKSENTPQNESAFGLIILSCALGLSCCVIALILAYTWKSSKNDGKMGQEIEMKQRTLRKDTEGNGYPELDNAEQIHNPSAPFLGDDNDI